MMEKLTLAQMDKSDAIVHHRLHIGNISAQLYAKRETLHARLEKYGTITKPISFHTKPLNDFYFAFVEMDMTAKALDKLKTAFNGVLFMGRKLTVATAKPDFQEEFKRRQGPTKKDASNHENIAQRRAQRITESQTQYPCNRVTGGPLTRTAVLGANNSSMGYHLSSHTFNNMSGNTKHKSPSHDLVGSKSYGSTLHPRGPFSQQYSRTSGFGEVVQGRIRRTPRPTAYFVRKQQTMRILINGELKQIKCYKTKLWGVEKNKTARDLTYSFHNNEWRSGDDHVVERVHKPTAATANASCGVDGDQAAEYGSSATHPEKFEADDVHFSQEKAKNAAVLAKLLSNNVFDKPLEIEEESEEEDVTYDSKGRKTAKRFDYEAEGVVNFDNDEDDVDAIPLEEANSVLQSLKAQENFAQEVYYDEDDEGNEIDMDTLGKQLTTEAIKKKYDEDHGFEVVETEKETAEQKAELQNEDNGSSSEEDLMPTFAPANTNTETHNTPAAHSTTETLRSLFNPADDASSGFQLALDEEDIGTENLLDEKERQALLEQIKSKQEQHQQEVSIAAGKRNKYGLFWSHFDSPFLQTQAQLSKIGHTGEHIRLPGEEEDQEIRDEGHGEEDAYERWFWSMRGEIGRECKRRKRDTLRMLKKKKGPTRV
ncbi:Nucleolar protein 8 [Clavispora lusitaniae]|nr:Nucleolar protein 8 [Clavispora lusitaniae]